MILALDRLTDELRSYGDDYMKISPELLKVAGDNGDMPFDSKGYRQAMVVGSIVYLLPLVIVVAVFILIQITN